ncbi:TetR family transcriptional regulator [Sulfurospirillum diekertiae]|uniref:TetR family transcriptional regulator n=1 Tax=Sulfurospirillum diekertiae TaxID=1854492 RepID=A0A290HEE1_9BACT|nr:TetR/AcrR family transcriptional regulator [Sulfurospirillum diekertiae]ATB69922.1 TetR family transcriptional regulator [Sulfurospirillum diekertiae]
MKLKTEAKRAEIIEIAIQIFKERGFEKTSILEISSRLGGSKSTLYNYFQSKEELFFETIRKRVETDIEMTFGSLNFKQENIIETLCAFGENFLSYIYSDEIFTTRMLAIAGDPQRELGKVVYNNGICKAHNIISIFLEEAMRLHKLRTADPLVAAKHLLALLESETLLPYLLHVKTKLSKEEITNITKRAIDVFIKAYGISNESKE